MNTLPRKSALDRNLATLEARKLVQSQPMVAALIVAACDGAYCDGAYCDNQTAEIKRKAIAGGNFQIVYQCLGCGKTIGQPVKKDRVTHIEPLKPFDVDLQANGSATTTALYHADAEIRAAEREAKSDEWWATYHAYLNSPEWAHVRRLVLDRAKGNCEQCRRRPAAHVHHQTYQRLGREELEDLLALCRPCHESYHPHMQNEVF